MSEQRRGVHEVPLSGLVLLFAGTVLLLQTLGVLSWSLWETLWRYWPVLLIITGLSILLRRWNVWLVSLLVLALLFGSLGLAIWQEGKPFPPGRPTASHPTRGDQAQR